MVRLRHVDPWMLFVPNNHCRTLLEFRLNAESGALCDTITLDVPADLDRCLCLYLEGGQKPFARSRFFTIPGLDLVFDTRTCAFYEFPDVCIALVCCR